MKRGIGLLAVLLALDIGGAYALQFTPIDTATITRDEDRPIRQSPEGARAFAVEAIPPLGRLPSDAELVWGGVTNFEWEPRDLIASDDRIYIALREDSGGNLVVKQMIRRWHPAWWRGLEQWWIRRTALPIATPLRLSHSCAHGVDARAVLRVLGARLTYLPYGGMGWPTPRPLSAGASVAANWSGTITTQVGEFNGKGGTFPIGARAAWISDTPEKPMRSYREVMLLTQPQLRVTGDPLWRWTRYSSADVEHVCLQ